MTTSRTYGEACAAAHALDLVGERWALLVVRELLIGPKRFMDLRAGLPQLTAPVLSQRLRDMEAHGLVRRRQLAPPASVWVYDLTDWGRELEPVLVELGRWGRRSPLRDLDAHLSIDGILLALRAHFDSEAAGDLTATFQVGVAHELFSIRVQAGRLEIRRGEANRPDATIDTDAQTLMSLIANRQSLTSAKQTGALTIGGDERLFQRLLDALPGFSMATI